MTQCEKVLRHLKDQGEITPLEALNEYGIMRLAPRISDLKKRGYRIITEMVVRHNRYGETVRVARYYFDPEEVQPDAA